MLASARASRRALRRVGRRHAHRDVAPDASASAPPRTWGESASRLASVVRLSWSEALARLGVWRLDHVLAIRMLAARDMSGEIAREVARRGARARLGGAVSAGGGDWRATLGALKTALRYSKSLRRAPDLRTVARQGGVGMDAILFSDLAPAMLRPAYVLFRDERERWLILVVRGTHSAKDMISNLTGSSSPHYTMTGKDGKELRVGYAHSGFLTMARFLEKEIKDALAAALKSHPGYEFKIVGHSLGGGVAVLLTEMLQQDKRFQNVGLHCYTFACPSVLSRELSESVRPFVTTCVNNSDLVPFVSFSKVGDLQREVVSTALEQRLLQKWRESKAAMTSAQGPTPSRFAAAAAAVGKQHFGPQKYPRWLRALQGLKERHDKLVESSAVYRQSLLIGKSVSKTSSKLVSLSGAFIAGIVSPRPRKKEDSERVELARAREDVTMFSSTNEQVGDTISQAVLATDICHDAHLAHANANAASTTQEEKNFEEYTKSARIALDEDFQKPLTAADMVKIYKAEPNAAQEVLSMQADISVANAAAEFGEEEATILADYYGTDLPPLLLEDFNPQSEHDPVIKRGSTPTAEEEPRDSEKRGTEKLYPAGRILHFVLKSGLGEADESAEELSCEANPTKKATPKEKSRRPGASSRHVLFADVDLDVFRRIILSRTMIADHFLSQYEEALDGFIVEAFADRE